MTRFMENTIFRGKSIGSLEMECLRYDTMSVADTKSSGGGGVKDLKTSASVFAYNDL